jgi:sarcosine oxidase subunit alpha
MSQAHRTAVGGRIDRTSPLSFSFDGRRYQGFAGDTLASALLANGVHLVGRSYKYHRPRGILSAGAEEPNGLVTVDRGGGRETPNLRATQVELYDGLNSISQNRWPALSSDVGAVNNLLAPMFTAGFYYKTFMGPRLLGPNWAWKTIYEPIIRRTAGLGKAPKAPDPDHYTSTFAHSDVMIIGAGPAGLAAALAAAESGARVTLCDEQAELGGSLLAESSAAIDDMPAQQWVAATLDKLERHHRVRLLPRTQAFGYFAQNFLGLAERVTDHLGSPNPALPRERLWQVRAKQVVLATGAIERPLVFTANDRPGIMLADAARTYVNRYGVKPGTRAVVLTASDTAYEAALDLHKSGVEIALIADLRDRPEGAAINMARDARLPIESSTTILATTGRLRVSGVRTGRVHRDGSVTADARLDCNLVLMSAGWTPSVHLFSQSRGKVAWSENAQAFIPAVSVQHERSAGACGGTFGLSATLDDGYLAGEAAARAVKRSSGRVCTFKSTDTQKSYRGMVGACPMDRPRGHAFVDFQHDVTLKDLKLATQEGFHSIEHVKRYTTTGMATDQGKTSNVNALAIVANQLGKPIPQVGLTTFRQPYTPVTFGTLAGHSRGDLFDPIRRTPIDSWAQENGAVFEDVGLWKRARYFPKAGEDMHTAVARECRTVRATAGIFDASTLGKIEVVGPDAAEFLERMYVNPWKKLEVGRSRYGILLNESGFIVDDGVVGRLAPDVFHVTTSTGGAPRVLNLMEDYLQTEFSHLKVWLTSTTEQWAVIAVQGPKAREILAPLVDDINLSKDRFPYMGLREGKICGIETRLFRVSFTGELGFEVNVAADYGRAAWEAIWVEARKYQACAYGTETMHVLRAEKGFIIVGQETDGTVTPDDAGLAWAVGKRKQDFVGKRSLSRPDIVKSGRKQLVGLTTSDPNTLLEEGSQLTPMRDPPRGTRALGHVTSSYWSASLGRSIALAMIADGRKRIGEQLFVPMPSGDIAVEVVAPAFVDPKGERVNA